MVGTPGAGGRYEGGNLDGRVGIIRLMQQGRDQVETEHREVGEIVVGDEFPMQVGVDEPQAPQASFPEWIIGQLRDEDAPFIANYHIFNFAEPVRQNSNLPPDIPGEIGQLAGQVESDKVAGRYPAAVEPLQPFDLARFQSCKVAVRLLYLKLLVGKAGV